MFGRFSITVSYCSSSKAHRMEPGLPSFSTWMNRRVDLGEVSLGICSHFVWWLPAYQCYL